MRDIAHATAPLLGWLGDMLPVREKGDAMEPVAMQMPMAGRGFDCRALWSHSDRAAWQTATGHLRLDSGDEEFSAVRGGLLGKFNGDPVFSMVWTLWLRPDWTTERFLAVPQEPWGFATDRLDVRWDGDRRWHDHQGRELEPHTRDAPFVTWRDAAFCHTPVLRHIGLDCTEPTEVEVLQLNVGSGHLHSGPYRYTPRGAGRWSCYDSVWDETTELHVDGSGIVKEIAGRLRRTH